MNIFNKIQNKYQKKGRLEFCSSAGRWVLNKLMKYQQDIRFKIICNITNTDVRSCMEENRTPKEPPRCWRYGNREEFFIDSEHPIDYPKDLRARIGTYKHDRPYVCEISDGVIFGSPVLALSSNGNLLTESGKSHLPVLIQYLEQTFSERGLLPTFKLLRQQNVERDLETVFPLVHLGTSPYHWTVEYLPKVRALETYRERTGKDPTVLIQPNPPDWVTDSLELLDINIDECQEWDGRPTRVKNLICCTHRIHTSQKFEPSVEDYKWIRRQMKKNVDMSAVDDYDDRVYISRQDASHRGIINEDVLIKKLEKYRFTSYKLSEMSLSKQIQLFAGAEMIVGALGAGLTNMIFSEDVKIIELIPDKYIAQADRHYYFSLSRGFNFDYDCVICTTEGSDLLVEIDDVVKTLNHITSTDDSEC